MSRIAAVYNLNTINTYIEHVYNNDSSLLHFRLNELAASS